MIMAPISIALGRGTYRLSIVWAAGFRRLGGMMLFGKGSRKFAGFDLPSACPTHLRRVIARLHLKLPNGIGRETEILSIKRRVSVSGAIDQEIVGIRPVAPNRPGRCLSGPPVERINRASLRAVSLV